MPKDAKINWKQSSTENPDFSVKFDVDFRDKLLKILLRYEARFGYAKKEGYLSFKMSYHGVF